MKTKNVGDTSINLLKKLITCQHVKTIWLSIVQERAEQNAMKRKRGVAEVAHYSKFNYCLIQPEYFKLQSRAQ